MRLTFALALTLGAWSSGAAMRAEAQLAPLDAALEAYREGRLDAALDGFESALSVPGNGPETLVQIHLHLGILRGTLGDEEGARSSFLVALSIDPHLEVPTELNPTLLALFDEVRETAPREGLEVALDEPTSIGSDAPTRLVLRVAGAPEGMVARFRVSATGASGAPWVEEASAAGRETIVTLPGAAWRSARELRLRVDALDAHGGTLTSVSGALHATASRRRREPDAPATVEDDPSAEVDAGGSVFESPWLWIVVGLVVAGGVTAGVLYATAQESWSVGPPEVR